MRVLVGVTGGVAAYKAAELIRELQRGGAEVEVAMTAGAERFVTPRTFAALTGRRVYTSLWQPDTAEAAAENFEIEHIAVAQRIDALVVAPCTAHTLARLAQGLADDFLSTLYLAIRARVIVAPAMNVQMWEHPATQANVGLLRERGVRFVEPEAGYLACGMTGGGRLAPVEAIAAAVLGGGSEKRDDLRGETVLITAGGTREPIDPVRFLGNRSSGRMGHALAEAAAVRGARVILITASSLSSAVDVERVPVATAAEMHGAVMEALPHASVVIGAAAVADFRMKQPAAEKIRRKGPLTLELEPTKDILAEVVAKRTPETLVIGFAAEIGNLKERALEKLRCKGVDAVVANDVSAPGLGFDSERNAGLLIAENLCVELPPASKRAMAEAILDQVHTLRAERGAVR